MYPELLHIGSTTIYTYAFLIGNKLLFFCEFNEAIKWLILNLTKKQL